MGVILYRTSQKVARTDGNIFLDEFHDTVSCNEKWRRKAARRWFYINFALELNKEWPQEKEGNHDMIV